MFAATFLLLQQIKSLRSIYNGLHYYYADDAG